MSNIRERKGGGNRRHRSFESGGNVNPMNYVSNLADAMLVLAIGIMAALVLHWNVDLQAQGTEENQVSNLAVELDSNDITAQEDLPDQAESIGQVYYDEENNAYYITYDREDFPKN